MDYRQAARELVEDHTVHKDEKTLREFLIEAGWEKDETREEGKESQGESETSE